MMSGFADAVGYELQCLLIHSLSDSSMCKDNKFFFLTGNADKKCEGTDRSTLTRFFAVPSPESFTYA